jgi:Transcriptional Coactivator p15 (PC4)
VSWDTFKGFPFLSIREWYRETTDSKWLPGKKGISIRRRELAAVLEALTKALDLAGRP